MPRSWVLTFTEGSDEVTARCYLHRDDSLRKAGTPRPIG